MKKRPGARKKWELSHLDQCRVSRLPGLKLYGFPDTMRIGDVGVVYEELASHASLPSLYHRRTDELILVTKGRGVGVIDGAVVRLRPGSILLLRAGASHAFSTKGSRMEGVVLFSPPMKWDKPDAFVSGQDRGARILPRRNRGKKR